MILSKIDKRLLEIVSMLEEDKRWECIITAYDYQRTKNILSTRNITILKEYPFIKSFSILINKSEMKSISRLSQVKFISSISKASALMNISKKILGVDELGFTGRGVSIAFIDTGINKHSDFCLGEKRIVAFKDFVGEKEEVYDDNGHGTFVAGVCAGNGCLSGGKYSGIAPQSKIISLKALDKKGEASADKILSAMEWVYQHYKEYDIRVVCMSFGSEPLGYNDPIMSGAEALWKEGIVVVAAAGNSGPEYQTIKSPGVSGQVITVGGFNDNRIDDNTYNPDFFEIAEFSSRGPAFQRFKPDLIAPSVDIVSCGINKEYTTLSGTSVATPMIAGLSALMIEKQPSITPIEVKRRLMMACHHVCFNRNFEGVGYPLCKNLFNDNLFN